MTRTFRIVGETLVGRTIEEVAKKIGDLSHELRITDDPSKREHIASTIMRLAADISVSAKMRTEKPVMDFAFDANSVDESGRLLYLWEIRNASTGLLIGSYVGKTESGIKRRRDEYRGNIKRLLEGLPYRKRNPDGFRAIHCALANAVEMNHAITLRLLRNVPIDEDIFEAERAMIRELCCTLNV
jgi:hypothetical protein